MFNSLGIGVGLRPDHYSLFMSGPPPKSVSWVEVITENFFSPRPFQNLKKIRERIPVVFHGVSMSLGSAEPLDNSYLSRLKNLVRRIEPEWVSDHLCWTGIDGENLHDLLPLPYTAEAVRTVSEKIQKVQDTLGRRILIENVSSYAEFETSEMSEAEFLSAVCASADCGILLDVNNIYVNSVNHGIDAEAYIRAIDPRRVAQLHLAGHSENDGRLIDTHDAPVCEEVWNLACLAVRRFGPVSAMIERDANIPAWEALEQELERLRGIHSEYGLRRENNPAAESTRTPAAV